MYRLNACLINSITTDRTFSTRRSNYITTINDQLSHEVKNQEPCSSVFLICLKNYDYFVFRRKNQNLNKIIRIFQLKIINDPFLQNFADILQKITVCKNDF